MNADAAVGNAQRFGVPLGMVAHMLLFLQQQMNLREKSRVESLEYLMTATAIEL